MAIDIAGFIADLKEHAVEHGFHVHDERHIVETYSLRQSWEVDLHPEAGCGGPIDLHLALDVDPKVLISLISNVEEMGPDFEEPEEEYNLDLYLNWAVPPLVLPPDLLFLATDLAGLGGLDLVIDFSAIDSYGALADAPERRLQLVGKSTVNLVDIMVGKEQLCEVLDRSHGVSEYILDRVEEWMDSPI
jgi:hypothetical protein